MNVVIHRLAHSASLEINTGGVDAQWLHVVIGGGCGCALKSEVPVGGVWIPLRGRLQLGGNVETIVQAGQVRITETDPRLQVVGRGDALWVGLLGSAMAWRIFLQARHRRPSVEAALLPSRNIADRTLRRTAVALVRAAIAGDADLAAEAVVDRMLGLQEPLAAVIARCPGRTYAQRRMVFLRLQRVRNFLTENSHLDIDNDELAHMASYSPRHFIRAFRIAYQETPHAYLVRQRLERAHRMLRSGLLAVAEVAFESGFENRSAFSRIFRQRFGMTAVAIRRAASTEAVMQTIASY